MRCPPIRPTQKALALAAACAVVLGGTEAEGADVVREAGSGGEADNAAGRQGGSNPDNEWASSALEGAPQQVVELLDALGASGVVEHLSRAVILLLEWARDLDSHGEMLRRKLGSDLKRMARTPDQAGLQEALQLMPHAHNLVGVMRSCAMHVNCAYHKLSTLAYYPGALFGDRYVARTAARVPSGATAVGYLDAAAVRGMAPLEARCHVLDAPRVAVLRRVLTGPCARHLVLSMGLRTLSARDGGSTYGLPQGAGFEARVGWQHDGPDVADQQQREQHQQQVRLLTPQPLRSLLMLLAVRPCDTAGAGTVAAVGVNGEAAAAGVAGTAGEAGAEAGLGLDGEAGAVEAAGPAGEAAAEAAVGLKGEVVAAGVAGTLGEAGTEAGSGVAGPPRAERPVRRGLPCRAVRLEITLRVARAAAGAAARAGDCGTQGAPCYSLAPDAATATMAVQALQFAWRHMPRPPGKGADGGRRRAAMREWAAAVADVASSGVVAHAPKD